MFRAWHGASEMDDRFGGCASWGLATGLAPARDMRLQGAAAPEASGLLNARWGLHTGTSDRGPDFLLGLAGTEQFSRRRARGRCLGLVARRRQSATG